MGPEVPERLLFTIFASMERKKKKKKPQNSDNSPGILAHATNPLSQKDFHTDIYPSSRTGHAFREAPDEHL